ncbi:hypothetical protein PHYSODRAFT_300612 [Phytophthora sojae]|uniref:Uncharacterized protein n=1 Tax=Phytophthora sojae (strain P6497) TaxID=1094619 RepID=G4ZGU0_PHYSP|nr:hypothetical protein PHYSODRAFT_300612 [Phytophthora sojae]EGZ17589.1 hypothetical protein PHYSODRAFT_300612 [Phytophthora sojae]|eukprot:XP_009526647.1 hypothetical protein PHYSODRAFT_300612 [Phytophthora sojae]
MPTDSRYSLGTNPRLAGHGLFNAGGESRLDKMGRIHGLVAQDTDDAAIHGDRDYRHTVLGGHASYGDHVANGGNSGHAARGGHAPCRQDPSCQGSASYSAPTTRYYCQGSASATGPLLLSAIVPTAVHCDSSFIYCGCERSTTASTGSALCVRACPPHYRATRTRTATSGWRSAICSTWRKILQDHRSRSCKLRGCLPRQVRRHHPTADRPARGFRSDLIRSGVPAEAIDIHVLATIIGGLPRSPLKRIQLDHGLRAAFEDASMRYRYNATGHEQTRDVHLCTVEEEAPVPSAREAEDYEDFIPVGDQDEDDEEIEALDLEATASPFRGDRSVFRERTEFLLFKITPKYIFCIKL